jgi:branched-chain amino acid transport system permease protein
VRRRALLDYVIPAAVFGALAFVPKLSWDIPKLFDSPISQPGTLQLLGVCLLFGGIALTYDLLFGFTGLM